MDLLNESETLIKILDVKEKFWDMFIIDALIGNTNRDNGNWGFILDKENGPITFAPIYDCGSCLNPLLSDKELEKLSSNEIKNIAINTHSCIKENNNKINYIPYIESMKNSNVNEALTRVFPKINIEKINGFINGINSISNTRKKFYLDIINLRYKILSDVYKKIN